MWVFDSTGQAIGAPLSLPAGVSALAYRPGGGLAAVAGAKLYLGNETGFGPPIDLPGPTGNLAYSSDGGTLALAVNNEVRFYEAATGRLVGKPLRHPATVYRDIAYHPDGRLLATACADCAVRIWDLKTGASRGEPLRHPATPTSVAFSPDGRLLATSCEDKTVRLWETATGTPVGRPLQHPGGVHTVVFSPDGRLLAASGREGNTHLWDTATGKPVGPPLPGAGFVDRSLFHPNGLAIAVVHGTQVRIYPVPVPVRGSAEQLRLWAEVRTGLELTADGAAHALDAAEWRDRRRRLGEWRPVAEDRPQAAAGPSAELLRLYGNSETVWRAVVSPDGRFALAAGGGTWDHANKQMQRGSDFAVRRLDLVRGTVAGHFDGHNHWVIGLALAPDGKHFASTSKDNTTRLWDLESGQLVRKFDAGAYAVAFLPDGRLLTTGDSGLIALWDPATGKRVRSWGTTGGAVLALAVAHDGRHFLTGHQDSKVRLWEVASETLVRTFDGHAGPVWGVAFIPGSSQAVSAAFDKTLRLWDLDLGTELRRYEGHTDRLTCVAVSADGRYVLSGSYDNTARLWEIASGRQLATFPGYLSGVTAVAFLPGGRCLTGSRDRMVQVWRLPTGKGPSVSSQPPRK